MCWRKRWAGNSNEGVKIFKLDFFSSDKFSSMSLWHGDHHQNASDKWGRNFIITDLDMFAMRTYPDHGKFPRQIEQEICTGNEYRECGHCDVYIKRSIVDSFPSSNLEYVRSLVS